MEEETPYRPATPHCHDCLPSIALYRCRGGAVQFSEIDFHPIMRSFESNFEVYAIRYGSTAVVLASSTTVSPYKTLRH